MPKHRKSWHSKNFKLVHQLLRITDISFERKVLVGFVELTLLSLNKRVCTIELNSKQCDIHRVTINEIYEATTTYNDPCQRICTSNDRSLMSFKESHYRALLVTDAERSHGELVINIPDYAQHLCADGMVIRVGIHFSLENPRGGIHFVAPETEGTYAERGVHLFSYGPPNSARLWFPCVDSSAELCTWTLEFTVDKSMTAVSNGDLIQSVYTPDMLRKTFYYNLNVPTSAPNISLAVGPFEIYVNPKMHEVTHFCLPQLLPLLKHTTESTFDMIVFFEEVLSFRFPYSSYKQVFVADSYDDHQSFASMTIFNTNLLHTFRNIDQRFITPMFLAQGLCDQYFGCFVGMQKCSDLWLVKGISMHVCGLYRRHIFGNNDYMEHVHTKLQDIVSYEEDVGEIVLDCNDMAANRDTFHFATGHLHCQSHQHLQMIQNKAFLVMRMINETLKPEGALSACFSSMLGETQVAMGTNQDVELWKHFLISTDKFRKKLQWLTGHDLTPFFRQWVHSGGHAKLLLCYNHNKRKNTLELEIRQNELEHRGVVSYRGPIMVRVQHADGPVDHQIQIDNNVQRVKIKCHSRKRQNKAGLVTLRTGNVVKLQLSDIENPVVWIRLDPEITILGCAKVEQTDYQWHCQMRYEACVVGQIEAIQKIARHSLVLSQYIIDTIEDEQCNYKVRIYAMQCYPIIANKTGDETAASSIIAVFQKMFGSFQNQQLVRMNNFSNFQEYFIQKAMPVEIAKLRNKHQLCPPEVVSFLFNLLHYNNNRINVYSDGNYRAALVQAVDESITPVIRQHPQTMSDLRDNLKHVLDTMTVMLNLDWQGPCYKYAVTSGCLKAIRKLQKFGHLPVKSELFKSYTNYGEYFDVRVAALKCLADSVQSDGNASDLDYLMDMIENDPDPGLQHALTRILITHPPFVHQSDANHHLDTPALANRIRECMNTKLSHDSRLRCDLVDLYHTLYGRLQPRCFPRNDHIEAETVVKENPYRNEIWTISTTTERERIVIKINLKKRLVCKTSFGKTQEV